MAVYTHIAAEEMEALLSEYDVGTLISAKGIAEGVENSNYLIETTGGRFILTIYEKRVDSGDLPFFLALLDHLADKHCPVPRTIHDRSGSGLRQWKGKNLALIEYLPGVSVSHPSPAKARAVGAALGQMHLAVADFPRKRANDLGISGWQDLGERCGADLDRIQAGLQSRVFDELEFLKEHWPPDLPRAIIHADLFPDNVLMLGDRVTGLIDFYFACEDVRAWDLAVTHAAWSFSSDGSIFREKVGAALIEGYRDEIEVDPAETAAFPILARGACLRFLLTRAWDWLNTPADALVTRKDPIAFLNRLDYYAAS